jgi:glutamine amidotransferase
VISTQHACGVEANLKLTAAFADGEVLHAVRYTTHGNAPTLYTRSLGSGRCVVSEPFDRDGSGWQSVPPSSYVAVSREGIAIHPFAPEKAELALTA